jgi:Ser/Thr protein kinase RdoA (MazF antagonist)
VLLQGDLVAYLLDRGLLSHERVASGDATIEDLSRRNRNFKVLQRDGPCHFLKQATTRHTRATLAREAEVLQALRSLPSLASHVPHFVEHDSDRHLLILEIPDAFETLDRRFARTGRWPATLGGALGSFLGRLHRVTRNGADPLLPNMAEDEAPWVLSIHRPDAVLLSDSSPGNQAFVRIIQDSAGIGDELDRLRTRWKRECLIHGDLKSANVAVPKGASAARELQVIDWELAGAGDPGWDLGSVWSDVLAFWLFSIPMAQDGSIEESLEQAPFPLARMRPYVSSIWSAYLREAGLDSVRADMLLARSIPYAAARLLQTGFESTVEASRVTTNLICLIQLAWNMMRRPREAASSLLGLDVLAAP